MTISINNWKLAPSLNALVHVETGEIQRLGEFHYILLETLIEHAGEMLPRTMLINEVWKNRVVGNNSLPTAIHALRVALGDDGRQQEIIKTIPKKGYLFSKESIVVLDDEPSVVAPATQSISIESALPGPARPVMKKIRISIAILALTIAVATACLLRPYFVEAPSQHSVATNESSLIIGEIKQPYQNITIYHLQHSGTERNDARLAKNAQLLFTPLSLLLTEHHSSLTLYYYSSVQKLSIALMLENQCRTEYQLVMNISNWLPNITKLGNLVYQEVERTLNEMPICR